MKKITSLLGVFGIAAFMLTACANHETSTPEVLTPIEEPISTTVTVDDSVDTVEDTSTEDFNPVRIIQGFSEAANPCTCTLDAKDSNGDYVTRLTYGEDGDTIITSTDSFYDDYGTFKKATYIRNESTGETSVYLVPETYDFEKYAFEHGYNDGEVTEENINEQYYDTQIAWALSKGESIYLVTTINDYDFLNQVNPFIIAYEATGSKTLMSLNDNGEAPNLTLKTDNTLTQEDGSVWELRNYGITNLTDESTNKFVEYILRTTDNDTTDIYFMDKSCINDKGYSCYYTYSVDAPIFDASGYTQIIPTTDVESDFYYTIVNQVFDIYTNINDSYKELFKEQF